MLWQILSSLMLSNAIAGPTPPGLCPAERPVDFTCPIGGKTLAVCGKGANAVYRYGKPGRIEVEAGAPAFSFAGDSGGGESQIAFRKGGYSYVVYDWAFRTKFGTDGRNDMAFINGVLVRRGGVTLADLHCSQDPLDNARDLYHAGEGAPEGAHVEHDLWCPPRGIVRHGRAVGLTHPKRCT